MHVSQKTNTSVLTKNQSDETFDKYKGEDDMGGRDAIQSNNGSDEEMWDSNGEESDQDDTTPQVDKVGGETHLEDAGSCRGMAKIREVFLKKKSSKDDSLTTVPELDSNATEEEW